MANIRTSVGSNLVPFNGSLLETFKTERLLASELLGKNHKSGEQSHKRKSCEYCLHLLTPPLD